MEGFPGLLVDLGFKRRLQRLVRIVRTEKIGLPDKEAFLVVIGIDEPTRYAVGVVAVNLTRVRVKHIHTVNLDLNLTVRCVNDFDVRLSEDDEEVAFTCVF